MRQTLNRSLGKRIGLDDPAFRTLFLAGSSRFRSLSRMPGACYSMVRLGTMHWSFPGSHGSVSAARFEYLSWISPFAKPGVRAGDLANSIFSPRPWPTRTCIAREGAGRRDTHHWG